MAYHGALHFAKSVFNNNCPAVSYLLLFLGLGVPADDDELAPAYLLQFVIHPEMYTCTYILHLLYNAKRM